MEYIIYGLKDPQNNLIRYVGISKNIDARYKSHLYTKDNNGKNEWIEDLKKISLRPELVILHTLETNDRNVALNKEKEYIKLYENTILNIAGTKKEKGKQKNKYTTISVDTEIRSRLEKVMAKLARRMTYNEIINHLVEEFLKNDQMKND
jgi:predicted GIY-YIG superfamily endonuclease